MSILIKGMKMPTNCAACRIGHRDTGWDNKDNEHEIVFCPIIQQGSLIADANVKRHQLCPLVPVPPHGSAAIEKVISERISQIERWGESSYNHPFEWMSILREEFGELCEAVNETCFMNGKHPERGGDENIIREATQIAAVAIAIIEDFLPSDTAPTIIPADPAEEENQ